MLKGMCCRWVQIDAMVRFDHTDIVGNDIPIHPGGIHSLCQGIMIDTEACDTFHVLFSILQKIRIF